MTFKLIIYYTSLRGAMRNMLELAKSASILDGSMDMYVDSQHFELNSEWADWPITFHKS